MIDSSVRTTLHQATKVTTAAAVHLAVSFPLTSQESLRILSSLRTLALDGRVEHLSTDSALAGKDCNNCNNQCHFSCQIFSGQSFHFTHHHCNIEELTGLSRNPTHLSGSLLTDSSNCSPILHNKRCSVLPRSINDIYLQTSHTVETRTRTVSNTSNYNLNQSQSATLRQTTQQRGLLRDR
ncbi:hypothetical protein IWZ03DRAFT_74514 [Phyllosticta citriasiana]|uniref:Uncharacterized protein n=1 Tax=Phyllosticta citriasiana TaxID=595635 RepID=A0ABR1KBS8_9PEZI